MNSLPKAIRQTTGQNVIDFVREVLKLNYQTFCYRLKSGTLHLEDYHRILSATGMTFEDLFPNPVAVPRQLQSIQVKPLPPPAPRKPIVRKPPAPRVRATTVEELNPSTLEQQIEDSLTPEIVNKVSVRQEKKENPADDLPFIDIYSEVPDTDTQSNDISDPHVAWKPKIPPKKK